MEDKLRESYLSTFSNYLETTNFRELEGLINTDSNTFYKFISDEITYNLKLDNFKETKNFLIILSQHFPSDSKNESYVSSNFTIQLELVCKYIIKNNSILKEEEFEIVSNLYYMLMDIEYHNPILMYLTKDDRENISKSLIEMFKISYDTSLGLTDFYLALERSISLLGFLDRQLLIEHEELFLHHFDKRIALEYKEVLMND